MLPRPQRPILSCIAAALASVLTPGLALAESTIFKTTFSNDVMVTTTTPAGTLSSSAANWYVMSSKTATTSSVNGIAGLRLTHSSSTSAVVEAAARLVAQPIQLASVGDYVEVTGTVYTDKVLNLVFGLYNSGGVEPLVTGPNGTTVLASSGLGSTAGAVGGTLGWTGYRSAVANASTAASFQARAAQTGTPTYVAYDLLSVGTGVFNSPTAISVGTTTASTTSVTWADGNAAAYRFTYRIQRSTSTAFLLTSTIKDESNTVLYSATGTTTAATALPAVIATAFDSFAIGVRNNSSTGSTVAVLSVTDLKFAGSNSDLARITVQPASQSLTAGQSSSLSVTAVGTGTLSYQWYKDGAPISGATSATYPISDTSAGSYTVTVSNVYGYETSSPATVSVATASIPSFTTQPSNQTVDAGTTLTLTAVASGAPTPTYQWYLNDSPISGATSASYTVASATTAHAGSYKVVATNSLGSATSNVVTVTVNTAAPIITTQPQPVTVNVGSTINLSVTVTAIPSATYQWYKGATLISGATSSGYSIASATTADAGSYTVVISNGIGSPVTSDPAVVTVTVVPATVSTPPANATVVFGNSLTLTASYAGSLPRTYQWYKDNSAITGATSASYTIASAAVADAGAYHVVVNNEANVPATSADATVTVVFANETATFATDFSTSTLHNATTPITSSATSWWILSSKNNATPSNLGDDAATADVVETRPLTLKFNGTTGSSIVEAAARFTNTPVSLAASGNYLRLTATLSGKNLRILAFGLYNSGGVNPFPLWGNPATDILGSGTAAVGIGTQNWVGYRGSMQATTSSGDIGTRPAQTLATNSGGTAINNTGNELLMPANSTGAAFSFPGSTAIGTVPGFSSSISFTDGTVYTLVYTITRSGSDQYTIDYKLFSGSAATGTPLYATGATTTAAVALPSAMTSSFDAVAIGFRNLDSSIVPEMTVTSLKLDYGVAAAAAAPSFTTQPSAQNVSPGGTFTLSAAATGTPNPTYQWYKVTGSGDQAISGATSASYTVLAAAAGDAGNYKVVATNAVGATSSDTVAVTVGTPATPYQTWAAAQGLTTGVNDGATQDPDGDGVNNLIEFVLGGNPLSAASAPAPVVARSGSNLTFTYDVKTAATAQFTVSTESSADLATWTTLANGVGGVTVSTTAVDANTNRVVVTVPVSGARLFLRLRAVAP